MSRPDSYRRGSDSGSFEQQKVRAAQADGQQEHWYQNRKHQDGKLLIGDYSVLYFAS
jgi:hypothetical protein